MDAFIGELAALAAAFSFSLTSVLFTLAGRRLNAVVTLATSLPLSWLVMLILHQAVLGTPFPFHASARYWLPLATSGILAFVVSAWFMLSAYQFIGPRLTMLIASFAPVLGALLAFVLLGQALPANSALGIALVIAGIVWVVAERGGSTSVQPDLRRGVVFAVLGTVAQGAAFVFSSQGVADGFHPFSATLLRISAGIVTLWLFLAWRGEAQATVSVFHGDRQTFMLIAGAAILGPVMAGSFLLLALQRIPVGVATTLSHTTAIMLIPIGWLVFGERVSPRAIIGTCVAIAGIALLFM